MYAVGVLALLGALVYFVASVGPAPSGMHSIFFNFRKKCFSRLMLMIRLLSSVSRAVFDKNKTTVFGALFGLLFFYVAPNEVHCF